MRPAWREVPRRAPACAAGLKAKERHELGEPIHRRSVKTEAREGEVYLFLAIGALAAAVIVVVATCTSNRNCIGYKTPVSKSVVTVMGANESFNGRAHTPPVIVRIGGKYLANNLNYKVEYENNVNAGTAKAIVRGIGSYKGKKTVRFTIEKAELNETLIAFTGKNADNAVGRRYGEIRSVGNLVDGRDYLSRYKVRKNRKTGEKYVEAMAKGRGNYDGTLIWRESLEKRRPTCRKARHAGKSVQTRKQGLDRMQVKSDVEALGTKKRKR